MNTYCLFCDSDKLQKVLESDLFVAVLDKFPVNDGHTLIIPKRHIEDFFSLNNDEANQLHNFIVKVKEILDTTHKPDGYNIGINNGHYAGQTIFHLHIHLIPRYKDDVPQDQLKGGIRNFKDPLVKY